MPNVVRLLPAVAVQEDSEPVALLDLRPKFSFDMSQPDPRGFVLIDACVPFELAVEFMNLVNLYNRDGS